jgi:enamine deaminase RidA (YjgF/YER057c/UK114 family)
MTRRRIRSGSTFEAEAAYSRLVLDGDFIFMAGTTGYDYTTMVIQPGIVEQTEQCFRNIESALALVGSDMNDIVRVTYILPNRNDFPTCWPILRRWLGDSPPAATMFEARLLNDDIRIEIEVTARRRTLKQVAER